MKVVILCGGKGTRLREETEYRPKPMVPIGGRPILWHIMKTYAAHGFNEFILCLGYKGGIIKDYFRNYQWMAGDVSMKLGKEPRICFHDKHDEENWSVTLAETGEETMTGGRLARVAGYLDEDDFCLTYGDGVSNVNIAALIDFHRGHGKQATLTAVEPVSRFGNLVLDGPKVATFSEKPTKTESWINGGFFVLSRRVIELIDGDHCIWERRPLEMLTERNELMCYRHEGFWHCMDNIRDKVVLEQLWQTGAPWKTW